MSEDQNKLHEDIGFIKATVKEIKEDIRRLNGSVSTNDTRITKLEMVFGKIGVAIAAGIFLVVKGIDLVVEWLKDKF